MEFEAGWPRSCHGSGLEYQVRGERELRGERRGTGGRSWLLTTVPPFLLWTSCALTALLTGARPAAGQLSNLWLRAGVIGSTRLIEDEIASGALRTQLGPSFSGGARATPSAGIAFAAVYEIPLRSGVALESVLGFSHARLRASDAEGSRDLHGLSGLHGTVGFRSDVARAVHLSAGLGALRYFTARRGIFAAGSELSPLAEAGAGVHARMRGKHVQLRALVQAHRFGTPALRRVDAQAGGVLRFSLQAGVAPWRRP